MTDKTSVTAAGSPASGPAGVAASDFANDVGSKNIREAAHSYVQRLRGGELGALPALIGLLVLVIVFATANSVFVSKGNFANFLTQAAPIAIMAMGLVFVLLLGEIDLSAGTASGVCASVMALGVVNHGKLSSALGTPTYLVLLFFMIAAIAVLVMYRIWAGAAIAALGTVFIVAGMTKYAILAVFVSVAVGVAVGTLIGFLVARVGIPSFVVTLALFLAWQGVLLKFIGQGAAIPTKDFKLLFAIDNNNMSAALGWVMWAVTIGLYALYTVMRALKAKRATLVGEPLDLVVLRIVALGLTTGIAVLLLNENRSRTVFGKIIGVPWAVPLVGVALVLWTLVLAKSRYGRFVYAVGGNAEAARRAGIDVIRIRLSVFVICSGMAGLAGVIAASKQGGVDAAFGNGTTLLYAVGAAVIGGTSLFGGKGKVRDAVIGALVISIIANGLPLLRNINAAYEFLITGAVLLLAASVDALSRRRASANG
jgi:D-xylose transport system permease protein